MQRVIGPFAARIDAARRRSSSYISGISRPIADLSPARASCNSCVTEPEASVTAKFTTLLRLMFSRLRAMRFRLSRTADSSLAALGPLEIAVMELLWERGESSVHDVVRMLSRPLAYTTVMTTLDRLFKKGLLDRRKSERAFVYSPRLSRREWEEKRTGDFVAGFLAGPKPSGELLVSCLVEAVGRHDEALLDELEKKIRMKRRELYRKGKA